MFMITVTYLHTQKFDTDEELLEENKSAFSPFVAECEEILLKLFDDGILMNIGSLDVELPDIANFDHYCETQEQVDHYLTFTAPFFEKINTGNAGFSTSVVVTEIPSIPWEKHLLSCLSDGKLHWQPV